MNKQQWDHFLDRFPSANFLQSWSWGEFHRHFGHPVYRVATDNGMFQAIVEPARRARYLTVPGGPLVKKWDYSNLAPIIAQLTRIARDERCAFIRIRPQVLDSSSSRFTLSAFRFRLSPMHLHAETTRVLDLNKSDDELLSDMRKSTRYEVRRAQKLGIEAEMSDDERLINQFVELQDETSKREHFVPFSKTYLLEQFRAFKQDDAVRLFFIAERPIEGSDPSRKDRILAMAFVIFYREEAVYHYAASSDDARDIPAASAIQWAIIQEAKRRGCTTYNLWGDVPDQEMGHHRFSGPSLFKRGFGGQQISYLPAHDLPLQWTYWINWGIERIRKLFRNL